MKAFKFTFMFCVCLTANQLTPAQTPTYSGPKETYRQQVTGREVERYKDSIRRALEFNSGVKKEPRVIKSGLLAPSDSDIQAHKEFLSKKNTGLLRLLPRGAYDIKLRGGGSYYSFFYQSHEYGYGSDIGLEFGLIKTGFAGADYGILTNLGDATLEELTLEDGRVGFLADYKPPVRERDARSEIVRIRKGFTRHGQLYASMALGEVDSTYLVRSISYNRSDVLVAFRVVRKDTDESLIITWKMLKKYSTPILSH